MAAAALPIALVLGVVAEVASGLLAWRLGGEKAWWRQVTDVRSDVLRLLGDKDGSQRASAIQAAGAAAALFGAGMAAAGALGYGPDDLPLLYLALALAAAGSLVALGAGGEGAGRPALLPALAEASFAVGLGVMFVRYGALDLEAVRGTQQVLGTGVLLAPGLAATGLVVAALALCAAGALRMPPAPVIPRARRKPPPAGPSLLARLCRWSLSGATALLGGVLLAGGGLEPFEASRAIPAALGAVGIAVVIGAADALRGRLVGVWLLAAPGVVLVLAAAAAAMVVLA